MREIYYNSDITPSAANEIKLLTLYYDKITIVSDVVYSPTFKTTDGKFEFDRVEDIHFIPKTFRDEYKMLLDEGIMAITKRDEQAADPHEELFAGKISKVLYEQDEFMFPLHPEKPDGKIITKEMYDMMHHVFGFNFGDPIELHFVRAYYSYKLKWFIKLLIEGQNCIGGSNNLNHLLSAFIKESEQLNLNQGSSGYTKSLAFDALKIALPNPENLSIEDILELKLKLKDELGMFYQTINAIEVKNKQLFGTGIPDNEYEAMFFSEIQKPLTELETKMKNLKSKTFRQFVDKMKDYKTYVPMVGTVVASMPMQYAVLASIGMTVGQSFLEFKEDQREISNNGLYFLLKLK